MMKKIVTHSGIFHADDVFATAMLQIIHPQINIERVRQVEEKDLEDNTVYVIDVGCRCESLDNNYDHHQSKEYQKASAGLVWYEVGTDIISNYVREVDENDHEFHVHIKERVYENLLRSVDLTDLGKLKAEKPLVSISQIISGFNPVDANATEDDRVAAFYTAVSFAKRILLNEVKSAIAWVEAKDQVLKAHVEDRVLILIEYAPWQEHIFERKDVDDILYVIFPSLRGGFQLQQVPVEPDSFEGKKPLPAEWAGLRNKDLEEKTGVQGAEFCHPGRFIGGAKTFGATLELAKLAVDA